MSGIPFPLEIVIEQTPISLQGSSAARARWRNQVSVIARNRLGELIDWYWLDDRPVSVTIFYFPVTTMQGDIDNIVKPILDGLKAVSYPDDNSVERILVQKSSREYREHSLSRARNSAGRWIFRRPSSIYAWTTI